MRFFAAVSLAMVGLAVAQEKDPWIGKRVFTQFGAVLKVGKNVVDDEGRTASLAASGKDRQISRVYRVEHTNGEWLWLRDEKSGASGWVQSRYVIPYEQAIDFYTSQIRSNPQAWLYCSRGSVWLQKGEYDKAFTDFNEAIRLEPGAATYWSNRGNALMHKKEYDKAVADFNEAIRLDPKYAKVYNSRGYAWVTKKEYDKAFTDFNEAIRLDSKDAWAYHNLAWFWATCPDEKYRDSKKSIGSATKACELTNWKDANKLGILAAVYAESGDFDKAVEWQEKANKLNTDAEDKKKGDERLKLYKDKKPYRYE